MARLEEPKRINLPLWREAFTWVEYLKLKGSGVYYGFGVPHGDNSPVIVVPGLLASDFYLLELRLWLWRIGYRPYRSRIGLNAECPELLVKRLLKTVDRAYARDGRKVHLIGHSLGGVLARGVAAQAPDKVASVITLASPFRGVRLNPVIADALAMVRRRVSARRDCPATDCFSRRCTCAITATLRGRFPSRIIDTAIYTRQDGVVDWHTCVHGNRKKDVEVEGSHIGLAWNPQVYRVIAERLAQPLS